MRILGLQITVAMVVTAVVFYFIGAKKPALANKVWK
jgi:hypothetical protein